MSEELKACPYCGSEPGYIKDVDGEWIWCSNVECMGGNGNSERWNTRPLEDALRKQLAVAMAALEYYTELHMPYNAQIAKDALKKIDGD